MRPTSHRDQIPEQGCHNCRHSHVVEFKGDLLCFHGDDIVATPSPCRDGWTDVELDGECVGIMDGDEWSKVWAGRVIDGTDVCDEWEEEV